MFSEKCENPRSVIVAPCVLISLKIWPVCSGGVKRGSGLEGTCNLQIYATPGPGPLDILCFVYNAEADQGIAVKLMQHSYYRVLSEVLSSSEEGQILAILKKQRRKWRLSVGRLKLYPETLQRCDSGATLSHGFAKLVMRHQLALRIEMNDALQEDVWFAACPLCDHMQESFFRC